MEVNWYQFAIGVGFICAGGFVLGYFFGYRSAMKKAIDGLYDLVRQIEE